MATIWSILRPILRRQELARYDELADAILAADIVPTSLERTAAIRAVVCASTGIQPSEFDKLSKLEQLPFLQRAAADLTKPQGKSTQLGRPTGDTRLGIEDELIQGTHPDDVARMFDKTTNYVNKIRRELEGEGRLSAD